MKRHQLGFVFRIVAGMAALAGASASATEYYDLRVYEFRTAESAGLFDAAMESMGVDGLKDAGATTLGVFKRKPEEGKEATHERYLLLASENLEELAAMASLDVKAATDDEAVKKYLSTPKKDPAYTRIESTLLAAFAEFPKVVDPKGDGGGERYFELRTYESHDELKAQLKVEMFNEGGEIGIFKETGLRGVFFGAGLIGTDLPKLTYMLVHENDAEKEKAWDTFKGAPAWDKLKKEARYVDTVSKIDARMLVAMPYSPLK